MNPTHIFKITENTHYLLPKFTIILFQRRFIYGTGKSIFETYPGLESHIGISKTLFPVDNLLEIDSLLDIFEQQHDHRILSQALYS